MNYNAAHQRIRKALGKATNHLCPCGQPACDWAYQYSAGDEELTDGRRLYSTNSVHYKAMCRRCHKAFDAVKDPSIAQAISENGRATAPLARAALALRRATDLEFAAREIERVRGMGTLEGRLKSGRATMALIGKDAWSENAKRGGITVSNQRRQCECGLVSNPGAIGRHLSATGHTENARLLR